MRQNYGTASSSSEEMERLLSWHTVYSLRSKKQRGSFTLHTSVQSPLTYFESALIKRDLAITFMHAKDVTLIDPVKKYSLSSLHSKIIFYKMGDYCTLPGEIMEIMMPQRQYYAPRVALCLHRDAVHPRPEGGIISFCLRGGMQ